MNDYRHDDAALTRALRALADAEATLSTSPQVEARLRAEAEAIARAHRRRVYTTAGALVAAAIVAAIAIPEWRSAILRPAIVEPSKPAESSAVAANAEEATEFFPLQYSSVPITNGETVRLEVPRAVLTSFGLEAGAASGTVLADIIVGQDGLARAVRFVEPAVQPKEQKP
jgi:hypothetical protein